MSFYATLISRLSQAVGELQYRYINQRHQFVQAKFDPALFSENFQPLEFYFSQMNHTLAQLCSLSEQDAEQITFFSEKLLAQCTAISDVLTIKVIKEQPNRLELNVRQLQRQRIDALPPSERLVEYYNALHALNEKLNEQKDQHSQCQDAVQQAQWEARILHTRQRRQTCLEAIEVLEEYLAFKQAQEDNDNK